MDFALNELQRELSELAARILGDSSGGKRLAQLEASGNRLDLPLWQLLVDSGLSAVAIAEENGGAGLTFFEACLVLEQLGKTVAALPLLGHTVAALALQHAGEGEFLQSLPAKAGWLACSARTQGNSLYWADGKVHGRVGAVPYARGSQAMLLPARVAGEWRLCRIGSDQPGIALVAQTSTALEPQALVSCEHAEASVIGDTSLLPWLRQRLIVATCAAQTGIVDAAIAMTTHYISEREQFGVKIGSFQAVSHRMADAWIDLVNLRLMSHSAAALLSERDRADLEVLSAQVWAADAGHRVLASCQHVHGGMGHDRDYPLWRYAVWARHCELAQGNGSLALAQLGEVIAADPVAARL